MAIEEQQRNTIVLNVAVSRQLLMDLLCTAVEGGSNYWATFSNDERTADLDYTKVRVTEREASGETRRVNRYITPEDMANGLERLARATFPAAGKHLADALTDNHDAATADVVLQMAIFGDVVYG